VRRSVNGGLAALALLAPVLAVIAAMPGDSAAASCRGMTLAYSVSGGGLVVLSPSHVDVAFGGCVSFTNQTAATATVTVGSHYSQQVAPNSSTAGSHNFVGTSSGRLAVTATSGPGTAHGSITVGARPSPAPSPSRTATPTPSLAPTPTQSPSGGTGPQVAPTPKHHRHKRSPTPGPGGVIQPPVSPPGPIQLPSAAPSPAPTAIVAGPIEPASGRGVGLPAAIAAVAVLGTGAALVRVVAAEPVDSRKVVGRSS